MENQSRTAAVRALARLDEGWKAAGVPEEEYHKLRRRLQAAVSSPPLMHYLEAEVKDTLEYWSLTRQVIELLRQGAQDVPPPPAEPLMPMWPSNLPQGGKLFCLSPGQKKMPGVEKYEGARAICLLTGEIYLCIRQMGAWVTYLAETSLLGESEYTLSQRWDPNVEVLEPLELQELNPDHPAVLAFYSTYVSRWEAWVDYEAAMGVYRQEMEAYRQALDAYENINLSPSQKLNGFGYYNRVWEEDGIIMTLSPEGYPMRATVGHLRWIIS